MWCEEEIENEGGRANAVVLSSWGLNSRQRVGQPARSLMLGGRQTNGWRHSRFLSNCVRLMEEVDGLVPFESGEMSRAPGSGVTVLSAAAPLQCRL